MPYLNATIEKIWETITFMEEIPAPPNAGNEPPPGRRNREFCAYHRFHGHTTNNCRDIKKVILRMIDQGKLDHFLVHQHQNLPPPPPEGRTQGSETGRNTYLIEVGAKAKNLYCNSTIYSFKNIEDFHDNILSRVYTRDSDGREILNLAKVSPLKDWKKQLISFNTEEVPRGGEPHESPLVVKLEINPTAKTDEDEEEDAYTWDINKILIYPGSSVDILFYHAYKTMGGRDEELIPSTYKIYESPHNTLIGRPWLHGILGVASTFHRCIKFPLPQGAGIIRGDPNEGTACHEIDIDKCEERSSKRRNWKQQIKECQRAERLMVDVVNKENEITLNAA
ncbi:uncharacterized protein LOC113335710 [Papaver somniferum]|uniref:uncharacterized protein LOC113335710 n=1 Tax=Papaver somniferum TaxID=3469 RepID=UPI000E6F4D48|nr:uncharacterized protein LOC113335710 [Papaver somniferum]